MPDIVDYHLPEAGGFHNCAIVSIDKKYPKHAQKVMHAVWGAHMMSLTKLIVVVDSDCDVHDLHEVAWRALGNTDYSRDLTVVEGPVDHLDHASYQQFWAARRASTQRGNGPRRATRGTAAGPSGPVRPGDGGEGDEPLEGVRPVSSASAAIPQPGRTKAFLRLVMIEHSVFALPFAYIAALTAMFQWDRNIHWGRLFLVTVAMVGLRTFAMAANRIIDREIDARNPRTAHRELVTGAMSVRHAWTGALVALVFFLGAAALLNPLCLALAPIAVIPMVVYPYGKRFTNFPQAILGLAQAMGPVGGWLAISGTWDWDAVVLGLAVGVWIGGFDLIYACQDVETDREIGVMSVPARFGVPAAIWGARACHTVTTALFVWYAVVHRRRCLLLARPGDRGGCLRLRAHHRPAARPEPCEPRLLQRQRVHRDRPVRVRAARSPGARPERVTTVRAARAARTPPSRATSSYGGGTGTPPRRPPPDR